MVYPKTYLEKLIQDTIACYKSMYLEKGIAKRREKQINMLESLCHSVKYDSMLITRIKSLVEEIDVTTYGWIRWIYAPRSRFAILLEEALIQYEKTIALLESQSANKVKLVDVQAVKSVMVNDGERKHVDDINQASSGAIIPIPRQVVSFPPTHQLMLEAGSLSQNVE